MSQELGADAYEQAMSIALSGIADGVDLVDIARELEALHPKNKTFPGDGGLVVDAIEESGATRAAPLETENIRKRVSRPNRSADMARRCRRSDVGS